MFLSPQSLIPTAKGDPAYASLDQLFNGNAYFERQTYTTPYSSHECPDGIMLDPYCYPVHEVAPVQIDSQTIYMYYRSYYDSPNKINPSNGEIGLAISTDGGAGFTLYNSGMPVVYHGTGCEWDATEVVAPSVVIVNRVFYMVYEGRNTSSSNCQTYYNGAIGLATSTDGKNWSKAGRTLDHGSGFESGNIGTPSIEYFNNQFYVFYHGFGGLRSKIGLASGPDPYPNHLVKSTLNPVMDVGKGDLSWDATTNSRASVVYQNGVYYMTFEGATTLFGQCSLGTWGWGIARSTNLTTWEKFIFNPIRQNYGGGRCGNDLPYMFSFNGTIRVYQREQGQTNILLTGTDPYLHVYQSASICNTYHRLGGPESDGWSAATSINPLFQPDYLCYGPFETGLPVGLYTVQFRDMIDTTSGALNQIVRLDINNATGGCGNCVLATEDVYRSDFVLSGSYQEFFLQLNATGNSHSYEWRTRWYNNAYTKQNLVFLRQLGGLSDTTAPTSSLSQLPAYSSSSFQVSWSGSDPNSGIWYFDTQYNDVTSGSGWTTWLSAITTTSAIFNGTPCHSYQFQVRARDNAGNLQSWSNTAQASTTVLCGLTVSPSPASVVADGISTSSITVQTQNNAQGRLVSFSTSLGTLSTASCTTGTGGSCGVTIKSNSNGIATVTATGTGYSSVSTTVTFTDFGVSALPNPLNINAGATGTWTITVNSLQSFTGTVTLTDTIPTGLTCSALSPSSVSLTSTTTSGTSSLSCSGGPGTFNVKVNGTSGTLLHTMTLTANIGDFSILSSPQIQTINTTSRGAFAITVNPISGFSGTVNLGASTGAASCSLSPSVTIPPSPGNATLSCSSPTAGKYTVTVTGTSGSLTRSTSVLLVVSLPFQFQDKFAYGLTGQMPTVGWSTYGTRSVGGGTITLVNDGSSGSIAHWTKVPSGVGNWTVSMRAEWSGGSYGTLHLDVSTTHHSYIWGVDGAYNQYIFYRDGSWSLKGSAFAQLGIWHILRMDMVSGKISLYYDGALITTYVETDPVTSLSQFGPSAGWASTDSFNSLNATALKFTLTLQGYDYDGGQEETLKLNNQLLAQLPTIGNTQNAGKYVTFSVDMTSLFVRGTNTLTFTHANWDCKVVDSTKNVQITDATGAIIFSDPTVRPLSCTQSITYTFTI